MARHHRQKGIKQYVERTLVSPEVTEVRIVLNPATQQYEPKRIVVKPAVYRQGKAAGPTTRRGFANSAPSKSGKK